MLLDPEPDAWTLARAFRRAGYETGAFSSNHLIRGEGFSSGFRTFRSTSGLRFLQRAFLVLRLLAGDQMLDVFRLADGLDIYKIRGGRLTADALRWIDGLAGRPFFAYVHSIDPHWPYRDHDYGLLPAELRSLADRITLVELLRIQGRSTTNEAQRGSPRQRELVGRYDEEIRYVDATLGALLSGLGARGLEGRTLVVVVGDHGEEFFERGGLGHGQDIDEFLIHVPLVFLWPGDARFAGSPRRIDRPVSLLDVLPTLADLCGLPPAPRPVLGRSLRPLLEGRPDAGSAPVVAESLKGEIIAASYREGPFKARIRFPSTARLLGEGQAELYDLARDPAEERPLDTDGEHAALLARARLHLEELWAERRSSYPAREEEPPAEPDEALIQRRALGYVD